jgi:hypothetical protein
MPRTPAQSAGGLPAPIPANGSTALALPDDIRADLLRAQAEDLGSRNALPRLKVMPAGAGLFEFEDDQTTTREVHGVILNSHGRNVLWDRNVDDEAPSAAQTEEGANRPACSSTDGRYGVPREGFVHLGLPSNQGKAPEAATARATGQELIACSTCPYNQFGSIKLMPTRRQGTGKGKATTNQRSVYVALPDRAAPVELRITPSSLTNLDRYLGDLLNRGIPVQTVVTRFRQEVKREGGKAWGVVLFDVARQLTQDEFDAVMQKRAQFKDAITAVPSAPVVPPVEAPPVEEPEPETEGEAEEIPF